MKNSSSQLCFLAMALGMSAVAVRAQSGNVGDHLSKTVHFSGQASGEAAGAVGGSVVGSVRIASGVAAVPIFASGAVVGASGAVVGAVGDGSVEGAGKLWDFANNETSPRPALNRGVGVPAPKPAPQKDPPPGAAMAPKM